MKLSLKQWRKAKDLTLEEVAEKVGVSIPTLRRWETEPGEMRMSTFAGLCKLYGIEYDQVEI